MSWVSPTRSPLPLRCRMRICLGCMPGRGLRLFPLSSSRAFGLVALESLASGTPVIASAVGGLGEFFSARLLQLLVPPSDVPSVADALARAAAGDGLPTNEECMAFAAEFSWNQMAQRLLTIYQKRQGAAA